MDFVFGEMFTVTITATATVTAINAATVNFTAIIADIVIATTIVIGDAVRTCHANHKKRVIGNAVTMGFGHWYFKRRKPVACYNLYFQELTISTGLEFVESCSTG